MSHSPDWVGSDSSMDDKDGRGPHVKGGRCSGSDSSMDDKDWPLFPEKVACSSVQIPLWTIRTSFGHAQSLLKGRSDSSMDDKDLEKSCLLYKLNYCSDSSMDDKDGDGRQRSCEPLTVQIPLWTIRTGRNRFDMSPDDSSDSSMDDKDCPRISSADGSKNVQIPLWTIRTRY